MIQRFRQVLFYLLIRPTPEDIRRAALRLSSKEFELFRSMQPQDQAHGARVADRLAGMGAPPHVVAAGYLHDLGKPPWFGLFWRCAMVLFPGSPPTAEPRTPLARARAVYHHHTRRAAELAIAAGSPPELAAFLAARPGTPWLAEFLQADGQG